MFVCVLVAGAASPSLARADTQRFTVESAKSRVSFEAFQPWTIGVFSAGSGFDAGAADGIFGKQTEAAVKQAQVAHSLDDDGIAGPLTWAALLAG